MKSAKLTQLLQPLVEDLGYEFVGIEHSSNPKNPVVVIYIDHADGIAIEDCEKVSREVAALLDVQAPLTRSMYGMLRVRQKTALAAQA